MGRQRKSRELLLQLLFQAETNAEKDHGVLLKHFWDDFPAPQDILRRTEDLYLKIFAHKNELDARIEAHAERWKLSRMSVVDRNVLRMAVYELLYDDRVPGEVAINEAIDIAKRFGGESSGAFVNSILDKVWKQGRSASQESLSES